MLNCIHRRVPQYGSIPADVNPGAIRRSAESGTGTNSRLSQTLSHLDDELQWCYALPRVGIGRPPHLATGRLVRFSRIVNRWLDTPARNAGLIVSLRFAHHHFLVFVLTTVLTGLVPPPCTAVAAEHVPTSLDESRRAGLNQALDPSLAPWQRQVMTDLLHPGTIDPSGLLHARTASGSPDIDGVWSQLPPLNRYGHTVIYDPVRDRMVVFGGADNYFHNDTWALSLSGTPTWTQLVPTGTPPAARRSHTAIYDPVRDRILVFGGFDVFSSEFNDVWALSLSGATAWTQLSPAGTPPTARYEHTAIYDPVRDRMVVYGGVSGPSYADDVWSLSFSGTPAWVPLTPTGTPPPARQNHTAVYDPVRDQMVVFGGNNPALNDVWALSLSGIAAWTQLTPTGTPPSARNSHAAIYDPVRDRIVVFGGWDASDIFNDVFSLSLSGTPAWTQLAPIGTPPFARYEHAAIYDPLRDRMVAFGGQNTSSYFNDVWSLPFSGTSAWIKVGPAGTGPLPRFTHTAIYDPVRDRMVVFGGRGGNVSEQWSLSLAGIATWSQLTTAGTMPLTRGSHTAIYDPVRDRMVVFGGGDSPLNDVWALSLPVIPEWSMLTPTGTPPSARSNHSAIYDPVRDRMVVFGGADGSYLNDVWALSLSGTPEWTQLAPTGTPPAGRWGHTAIYDPVRDRMVVFGGASSPNYNDTWELSLSGTPAWTQLTPTGAPPSARNSHTAIYDPVRDRMVVFGGSDNFSYLNDSWMLSLSDTPAWIQLEPTEIPPLGRLGHTAIYDPVRDGMVIFGGYDGSSMGDTWALTWGTPTTSPVLFASIEARADERGVVVRWNLQADEPISGFEVYRRMAPAREERSLSDVLLDPGLRTLRDDDIEWGRTYEYFVVAVLPGGDRIQSQLASVETVPLKVTLYQNYPNPFNPTTTISFVSPSKLHTRLTIYDVQGRRVRALLDEETEPGLNKVDWDGRNDYGAPVASGVYFYQLRAGKNTLTNKMVLLK